MPDKDYPKLLGSKAPGIEKVWSPLSNTNKQSDFKYLVQKCQNVYQLYLLIHETYEGKFSLGHLWEEAYQSLYEENTRKEAQTGKSSWLGDHKDYWSQ